MPKSTWTNIRPDAGFADSVAGLPTRAWDALGGASGPFTRHAFLAALETAGCIGPESGWQPLPAAIREDGRLNAAAPLYLKSHSHGEFVFDWLWADASHRNGLPWYPKLLVAVPVTPVAGSRLLGGDDPTRRALLAGRIRALCDAMELSSAHVNFCSDADAEALRNDGWLERFDWQYHWHDAGYRDFDDFLDHLRSKPRKNIRRERRRVRSAGWTFLWIGGDRAGSEHLDHAWAFYRGTFLLYGNRPTLNRAFFGQVAADMGDALQLCFALRDGEIRAGAVFWRDHRALYGRYWGSYGNEPDVHFETCYYQGIDYCLRHGLKRFEPGAQGEHKIRRGFLPVATRSFHYIRHPGLRRGIARWLEAEAEALYEYREQLDSLNPFPRASV